MYSKHNNFQRVKQLLLEQNNNQQLLNADWKCRPLTRRPVAFFKSNHQFISFELTHKTRALPKIVNRRLLQNAPDFLCSEIFSLHPLD